MTRENLMGAQERQKEKHNENAQDRDLQEGDKVLVMLLAHSSKLLARWQGLFEVLRQSGPVS